MNKISILVGSAFLAIVGTTPANAGVSVIQSHSAALARGSTFAWAPTPAVGYGVADPRIANEVTADRLRAVTELTLANKGYRQVADPAAADLLVGYTIVILPEADPQVAAAQGTLVFDLVERQTGRLVLRATSEKRVTGKDVSQDKLVTLLQQMTRSLPK